MADGSVVISTSGVAVVENKENPFTANGELSQKADYIISHSTITRTELHIEDPDAKQLSGGGDQPDEVIVSNAVPQTYASAPVVNNRAEAVAVTSVEVEVTKGSALPAQPQHAEEVKLKSKKKCCTVL